MVSNLAYWRWDDAYPIVRRKIDDIHSTFADQVRVIDKTALSVYQNQDAAAAVEIITKFSVMAAEKLHNEWLDFYGEIFARFRDFSTIIPKPEDTRCGCEVQQPGLTEGDKRRIVLETGTHYEIPGEAAIGLDGDVKATF
jgi:hypothetical protein